MNKNDKARPITTLTPDQVIAWNRAVNQARRDAEEQDEKIVNEKLLGRETKFSHIEELTERHLDEIERMKNQETSPISQEIEDIHEKTLSNSAAQPFLLTCDRHLSALINGVDVRDQYKSPALRIDWYEGVLYYHGFPVIRQLRDPKHGWYLYIHNNMPIACIHMVNNFLMRLSDSTFYSCIKIIPKADESVVTLYEPQGTGVIVADLPVILGYRVREDPDSPNVTLTSSAFRIPASQTPHSR